MGQRISGLHWVSTGWVALTGVWSNGSIPARGDVVGENEEREE